MRLAYADPPYPGMAHLYEERTEVDHYMLVKTLMEYDGWALSTSSVALRDVLLLCPRGVRIAAWVKPFASYKKGVYPAYAWEPVIFAPARNLYGQFDTPRDWLSESITLQKGLAGAKPKAFAYWIFEILGAEPSDDFFDIFPGTAAVTTAWRQWAASPRLRAYWNDEDQMELAAVDE